LHKMNGKIKSVLWFFLLMLLCVLFFLTTQFQRQSPDNFEPRTVGRIVIAPSVLLSLYGGDRYLASNMEVIRVAATGVDQGRVDTGYLVRAQIVAADLNPCNEDNYYLANGLLAWGGADDDAGVVLQKAMSCRFWDPVPAFFYGFNRAFFHKDISGAEQALELAAKRSSDNAFSFRKLAIMLRAESIADENLALDFLINQRDAAGDAKLRDVLDKRVVRLKGLVTLRDAQREFEAEYGSLSSLEQLVESNILQFLPEDPLKLGYEMRDGRVSLKRLKIAGMEE
jgi:hypothetical protein